MADHGAPFYVGYLPVPPAYRRFLFRAAPSLLAILAAVALVLARSQGDPGPAVWEDAVVRTLEGTVVARPYPMLFADDRGDGEPGVVLLVELGKRGGERGAVSDGRRVAISGWILRRDGRRMLEMEPGDAAVREVGEGAALPGVHSLGRVTLRGEIVDAKCFLGAMKPGEGRTHKECATLCVRAGIPPMFITRDAAGAPTYYLLLGEDGGPIGPGVHPLIADPVEITGELEEQGGLLRLRAGSVRRL